MRCPVCHCLNADDATQCGRCGAALESKRSKRVRPPHHSHLHDVEESSWFKGSMIVVTALLASAALGGAWWSLMHSGTDEGRNDGLTAQTVPSTAVQPAPPADLTSQPASAVISAAQPSLPAAVLPAAPNAETASTPGVTASAAAPVAAPDVASASDAVTTPLSVVTQIPPAPLPAHAPPPAEAVAGYVDSSGRDLQASPPETSTSHPAPAAATAAVQPSPSAQPSRRANTQTVAAQLAACDRFAWYQIVQHESCVWSICDGRWGRDGCPAYRQRRPPSGN